MRGIPPRQAELADKADVSQPMVAKLENPDIDIRIGTLEKVAEALGLVVDVRLEKPKRDGAKKAA
ncbi:MAG: helix-turn-helix transcriptional regulator [Deltaproteobacteria bacterium]|nr:helix-turn-helix transcriptional regulator [Deltaproteobacteria bacterium]